MNPKSWTTNWRGFYHEMDKRGKTFPDNSIITKLCETLGISEHELFVACEDQDYRNAKRKLNKIENGNVALIVAAAGIMASFVLLIFGIVNYKKSKKHISTSFHSLTTYINIVAQTQKRFEILLQTKQGDFI